MDIDEDELFDDIWFSIRFKVQRPSFSWILKDAEVFVGSIHAFSNANFFAMVDVLLEVACNAFIDTDGGEVFEKIELFIQSRVGYELGTLLILATEHI